MSTLKQRPSTVWLTETQKAVYSQFWLEKAAGLLRSLLQLASWWISIFPLKTNKHVFPNLLQRGKNFREQTHMHTCAYIHAHMYQLTLHTELTLHILSSQKALPFLKASSSLLALSPFPCLLPRFIIDGSGWKYEGWISGALLDLLSFW